MEKYRLLTPLADIQTSQLQTSQLEDLTHLNPLRLTRDNTSQSPIQTGSVHIPAPQHTIRSGYNSLLVMFSRHAQESLLDGFIGECLGSVEGFDFFGDLGEKRVGGVTEVVVVE